MANFHFLSFTNGKKKDKQDANYVNANNFITYHPNPVILQGHQKLS